MTQFLDTPVDKSLAATGTWTDIDLSSDVPVSATGAIFQVHNTHTSIAYEFGLRKKGSTDNRYKDILSGTQMFCIVGIDANRKCQGKIESTNVDFYLVGYTGADATLFTNAYDKSQTTTGAWTDLDLSSELPAGSVAAIFQIENIDIFFFQSWSLRKKGSTDDRYNDLVGGCQIYAIIGVDANRKCQFKIESIGVDFYLVGYLSLGEAETNGVDRSLGSTGTYIDITESGAPAGATGVFVDTISTDFYSYAARKNGTSYDKYSDIAEKKASIFVGLDDDKKWEGKIENTGLDFYTLGYFVAGIVEKTSSDTGTGVDTQAELLSSCSEAEIGVGADAALGVQAAVVNTDIGVGADAILELLSSRSEFDTGVGIDTLVSLLKAIAKYESDTGAGVDAVSEQLATVIQTEIGTGIDAEVISKIINVLHSTDEGAGAEAIASLLAEIESADTGIGLEAVGSRLLGSSDVGVGVDALVTLEDAIGVETPYTAKLGGVSLWIPPLGSQGFTITKEENNIPRFSFTLQNCSVNRTALEDHLEDAFVIYRGATPIFTGLINCDQIEYLSIDRIKVNGFAEWIGLGYLIYKRMADADAESADAVFIRDDPSSWTDRTMEAGNDTINDVTVTFNSAGDGIYIGDLDRFNSLKIKYSTKGVQSGSPLFNVQYSKGSDVWDTLDCVDESRQFTEDAGTYFIFMPTLPSDWAKDTVNSSTKYWLRITIASGSYSINPKLDRIWISQTDVCRVQFEDTAADTILGYLLADTDYSEDVTDQCPSDVIPAIRGEYESRLHWVAGLINALEWEDVNGDAQPYHWWIDDSKKVHVKQIRGTTYGDVTALLSVLGNRINYFNIANRVFGLGGGTSINQYRAIAEDQSAQDSLGKIRETTYRDNRLFDYALLKGQARKLLTQSKVAQEQIQCTMPIYDWFEGGYDICDIIKLHQPVWGIPDEQEYTICRVDISLSGVKLDVGIGREHLDNLQGDIQQQLAIHDVYMQGETSTFQVGPIEENYQRVDDTTVYPAKMAIEIPSNAKAINKALISWKLGDYQADVTGTGTGGGHSHAPSSPNTGLAGGHAHSGLTDFGGGFTGSMQGKAHVHDVDVSLNLVLTKRDGYLPESKTVSSESSHTHSNPTTGSGSQNHVHSVYSTGGPSGTGNAIISVGWGSQCESGSCIASTTTSSFASGSHTHSNSNTSGSGAGHTHTQGVTGSGGGHDHTITTHADILSYLRDIQLGIVASANDSPAHIHDIDSQPDFTLGIQTLADFSHSLPDTDTEPDFSLDLNYGIHEEPAGTIMDLIINGVTVGSYDGDATDMKIRGFLQNGRNDVILQPQSGENHKGRAQMDATIKVFMDTE